MSLTNSRSGLEISTVKANVVESPACFATIEGVSMPENTVPSLMGTPGEAVETGQEMVLLAESADLYEALSDSALSAESADLSAESADLSTLLAFCLIRIAVLWHIRPLTQAAGLRLALVAAPGGTHACARAGTQGCPIC